tara:strand:- start:1905 stop:2771 length:867 start_codon:yes stop_codon:yes gene_type:complete
MSIKQNGGVFGRNPTFNDVTIEGQLTFDGDIDINSDLKVDGDLEVTGTSKLTGNVSIGGAADRGPLNVYGTEYVYFSPNTAGVTPNAGTQGIAIGWNKSNGLGESIISFNKGGGATGGLVFADNNGGAYTERARINDAGHLNLTTGNLIVSSGKGIDFSATSGTGTSELFSDYEEGNWTPSLVAGVGTLGSTSTAGTYTKVGRVVTLSAYLKITDNGTGSTYLRVNNLPFPVASYGGSSSAYENGVSGSATSIYVVNGSSYFTMWKYNNTYPGATNATWYVSVSYFTA